MSNKEKVIGFIMMCTVGATIGLSARAVMKLRKIIKSSKENTPELKLVEAKNENTLVTQEMIEKELENFLEKEGWNCQETGES